MRRKIYSVIFMIIISFIGWFITCVWGAYNEKLAISVLILFIGIYFLFFEFSIGNVIKNQRNNDSELPIGFSVTETNKLKRLELTLADAEDEIIIIGINLEGLAQIHSTLKERLDKNCKIKLLALDPNGKHMTASSGMSGIDENLRKNKISSSLDQLYDEFNTYIKKGNLKLNVIDAVVPIGLVGIDTKKRNGIIIINHHLYKEKSFNCPRIILKNRSESIWYKLYCKQWDGLWKDSLPYIPNLKNII